MTNVTPPPPIKEDLPAEPTGVDAIGPAHDDRFSPPSEASRGAETMPTDGTVDSSRLIVPSSNDGMKTGPDTADRERPPADTIYPQLSHNPDVSPSDSKPSSHHGHEGDDPAIATSFDRSSSPVPTQARTREEAAYEKVGEQGVCKMHRFSLYETATRYYVVGGDMMDRRFRVLKIDRTAASGDLSIAEDDIVYTKREMNQLLNTIDDGNKATGGMKLKCSTWGILGFIRFTAAYYMLLITKRSQVAMIGGHYIYQVDGTELVALTTSSASRFKLDRHPEEARFLGILNNLDLTRSFYFSYSYDITWTLQHNIARERQAAAAAAATDHPPRKDGFNAMFAWNHYLLEPAVEALKNTYDWCLPVVHGYVDQSTLSVYGRTVYITIIARRSRFFAGARFLKRGANDLGYVANDVETEQIVSEMLTTSFHAPGPKLYGNPNYSSYVQHRGSIPLYWTQDNTGVTPKPPIEINLVDPFYGAAALHFDDLFERYGAPIYVLNLIKARERAPRESKLLKEYTNAINYLNQFLPAEKKIIYKAWDMSRASKSRSEDVIGTLEVIAEDVVTTTGFFHNGDGATTPTQMQNGVARTNCIDCLDRTNAAQFVIGKRALGHQLHALGVIHETTIDYDTDAVNLFTHMYHDHGDTIAVQYGGSHLVNTMETYRKINQWSSHSRDMVESFKRYYNNSFLDGQRQEAYNLFLGNYIFAQGQPMLWDLSTDYYLHHADPRAWSKKERRNYMKWFTPSFLPARQLASQPVDLAAPRSKKPSLSYFDDYWLEYYRPLALSSFMKIFSYKMNSTLRYIPFKSTQGGRYDLSPFAVRTGSEASPEHAHHSHARKRRAQGKKGVNFLDPNDDSSDDGTASTISHAPSTVLSKPASSLHHSHNNDDHHSPSKSRLSPLHPTTVLNEKSPLPGPLPLPSLPSPSPLRRHGHSHSLSQSHAHGHAHPQTVPHHHPSILKDPPTSQLHAPDPHPSALPLQIDKALLPSSQYHLPTLVTSSLAPTITRSEIAEYTAYLNHPLNLPLVISTAVPVDVDRELVGWVESGRGGGTHTHTHSYTYTHTHASGHDTNSSDRQGVNDGSSLGARSGEGTGNAHGGERRGTVGARTGREPETRLPAVRTQAGHDTGVEKEKRGHDGPERSHVRAGGEKHENTTTTTSITDSSGRVREGKSHGHAGNEEGGAREEDDNQNEMEGYRDGGVGVGAEDRDIFESFLAAGRQEYPLTVHEGEGTGVGGKRYKAYRRWLKGKGMFKHMRGGEVPLPLPVTVQHPGHGHGQVRVGNGHGIGGRAVY